MNTFLLELIPLLKKVNWKKCWHELQKIPVTLKYALSIVIIIGICYFGYQKFIAVDNLYELQCEVNELTKEVETVVKTDDYKRDLVYIVSSINILEETLYLAYTGEQQELALVKRFIEREHPNDPILLDIDAAIRRNELQYKNLNQQFKQAMNMCDSKILKDSTYLYKIYQPSR